MTSAKRTKHDWRSVRNKLRGDQWYLLGKNQPYSIAIAVMQDKISALRDVDVEVRTSNTNKQGGTRTCDIYLRLRGKEGT